MAIWGSKVKNSGYHSPLELYFNKRPWKALPFPINARTPLSAKVLVVRFDSEDSTISGYNHTVSSSVF